ncbi:YwqG family protein [Pseudoxanthomonas wuyuanensis]
MKTTAAIALSTAIVLTGLAALAGIFFIGYLAMREPLKTELQANLGGDMTQAAQRALQPHQAALAATRRAKRELIPQPWAGDERLASKLGGRAYWPAGQPFPAASDGAPMTLLAQIDLAEAAMPGYPQQGLLQFFISADDFYGAGFDGPMEMEALAEPRGFRVVYWPQVSFTDAGGAPEPRPGDLLPFDPTKPRRILFAAAVEETIGASDAGFEPVAGASIDEIADRYAVANGLPQDEVSDALYESLERFGHKLGGHPDFTQSDPRAPDGDWLLLLQLDSDDQMMWGDSGVANFFIRRQDLARADFSRVAFHWDCY